MRNHFDLNQAWRTLIDTSARGVVAHGSASSSIGNATLEVIAEFPTQQVTGVAVSRSGRVFVNFPFWDDTHLISVAEVLPTGALREYPSSSWNLKSSPNTQRFVCVQSVHVDARDTLWILDAGSPKFSGVIDNGAKLVRMDPNTNEIQRIYHFPSEIAPKNSYLNDVRVDTQRELAFLTDSNAGALIVLDLQTGSARRVLQNHASVKAEPDAILRIDGISPVDPKDPTKPAAFQADSIALDAAEGWLYYKALTSYTLYRIRTADLSNPALTDEELAMKVEKLGPAPASDGMEFRNGKLYITAVEEHAVMAFQPRTKKFEAVVIDPRLQWPDSLALGQDDWMYVTTSQIHRVPTFNAGLSFLSDPFRVFRFRTG
jgi:sugar lactone lactonase YvrE